jgi:hypothetical protein
MKEVGLIEAFDNQTVAIFVGAGLSIGAGLPSWYQLISELASRISHELPPRQWITGDALIDAAQAYINEQGLQSLVLFLKDKLDTTDITPTIAHQALVKLPISIVFTANYDDLLEQAYRDVGKRVHVVVRESDIAFMRNSPNDVNIIKLYGDLNQPSTIVLAREQYERFFLEKEQMLKLLETELGRLNMLYLGWSHSDPHFNLVFGQMLNRFGKFLRSGYAILFDLSDSRQKELERKHIHVIQLPGKDNRSEQVASWLNELSLALSLSSDRDITIPLDKEHATANPDLMMNKLEVIHEEVRQQGKVTRQSLDKMQVNILNRFDVSSQNIVGQIITELDYTQARTVQGVIVALDNKDIDENDTELNIILNDIRVTLEQVSASLDKIDHETLAQAAHEVLAVFSQPEVGVKHKLKIAIPLILPILTYEGEIELGQTMGLEGAWKALKNKLG